MTHSLSRQLLWPAVGLILAAVAVNAAFAAWLAADRVRSGDLEQQRRVADLLAESTFPLTPAVLAQLRGLTGNEFAVRSEFTNEPVTGTSRTQASPLETRAGLLREVGLEGKHRSGPARVRNGRLAGAPSRGTWPAGTRSDRLFLARGDPRGGALRHRATAAGRSRNTGAVGAPRGVDRGSARRPTAEDRTSLRRDRGGRLRRPTRIRRSLRRNRPVDRLRQPHEPPTPQLSRRTDPHRTGTAARPGRRRFRTPDAQWIGGARLAVQLHMSRCASGPTDESLRNALQQLDLTGEEVRALLSLGRQSSDPPSPSTFVPSRPKSNGWCFP